MSINTETQVSKITYDGVEIPLKGGTVVNGLQWKCDNVKNLRREFESYTGESVDEAFVGLDTTQVTDVYNIFYYCENLKSVPYFETKNVTNMQYMFYYCKSLT